MKSVELVEEAGPPGSQILPAPPLIIARTADGEIWQRFEPPDLIFCSLIGVITAELLHTNTRFLPFFRSLPCVFTLLDVSDFKSIPAEARRASVGMNAGIRNRGCAVIGASMPVRLVATVILRGVALVNRHIDNPTRFFATEDEARAWLEARRRAVAG